MTSRFSQAAVAALALFAAILPAAQADTTLLNVSYDPTRELYQQYNAAFARFWQAKAHQKVTVQQSHGGSGKQARAVIDGQEADVVTLGIPSDINAIQQRGLIAPGWQRRLPNNSTPYTSTVVFVVRHGNGKGVHDWSDLVRPGVRVITANPKTSSGGRMAYLGAYGFALLKNRKNDAAARGFVQALYRNVPKLDSGARGSTLTFTHGVGDVLLAWENEAHLIQKQFPGQYDIVNPSISVLAEPSVAVVDQNVAKHHTQAAAAAYLQHLYSVEGQTIAAQNYYRPRLASVAKRFQAQFPRIRLFTVEKLFGGYDVVQRVHFADGGVFDQISRR